MTLFSSISSIDTSVLFGEAFVDLPGEASGELPTSESGEVSGLRRSFFEGEGLS